jgi:DNA-binding transcriptional LysR family regulator
MGTLDLNHLTIFKSVAGASSFSRAADDLGMPKSSVSRSVAVLEENLGARLFHRTTRQVTLTTMGATLLDRIAPLLDSLEQTVRELPERDEQPAGEIRVTAPVDFGANILADAAVRFCNRHPAVSIDLTLTNRMVDLVKERFDMAFRMGAERLRDSSLVAKKAAPVPLQLFASPSYVARRGAPRQPEELADHDWIVFRPQRSITLEGPDGRRTVEATGRIVCDDMFFTREALRAGGGIGLLPAFLAEPTVRAGELVRILPAWELPTGHLWIVVTAARNAPKRVSAFRDFVLEILRTRAVI